MAFITVISETDFLIVQDLSLTNGKISVGPASGTDYSIARISTDLSIKYNIMIDYKNGIDIELSYPIIYKSY